MCQRSHLVSNSIVPLGIWLPPQGNLKRSPSGRGLGEGAKLTGTPYKQRYCVPPNTTRLAAVECASSPHPQPFSQREKGVTAIQSALPASPRDKRFDVRNAARQSRGHPLDAFRRNYHVVFDADANAFVFFEGRPDRGNEF